MSTSGEELGRYVLEARIARGGMGEVFRAAAIGADGFRKPVVIKRVLAQAASKELSDMFVAEAKLMTRLAHPNIVEVFDFGKSSDGAYYLVMELVDGLDLRAFADRYRKSGEPMPIPLALYVTREALRGLSFAHTQALGRDMLVHRDVSPGNILLSTLGEVKVADFGVALVASPDATTEDALIVGKPSYMAPEQVGGTAIDARADLFSLGVVLYELVAGRLPFSEDAFTRRQRGSDGAPRDLEADRPGVPKGLAALVRTALAPTPADRFPDARAMLRALDALRADGVYAATADDLAEAVSTHREGREPEQVIVIGRDIGREETRVERGEGGTAFTLSLETQAASDEPSHHTERLADDSPPRPPSVPPAPAREAMPKRRGWVLGAVTLAALATVGGFAMRGQTGAPTTPSSGPPEFAATASAMAASASAPPIIASAVRSVAPPPTGVATDVPSAIPTPWVTRTVAPIVPSATAAASDCTGTIKLMASHGWSVRGGPSAAEAPGLYSWRCGSYNLSATSRLDSEKRAASVVIREGKQAVVDLR